MIRHPFLQSHRGSAILVSLIVLILLSMMTTVFLERIWTFSQTSKGIETSNMAYYDALWVIEEQLIYTWVTRYQPWNIQNLSDTGWVNVWRSLMVSTGSRYIPNPSEGNSSFDSDYNIITLGEPIQLVIPEWIDWANVNFDFRIPTINGMTWDVHPSGMSSWYILWTIGYTGASLFANGETEIFRWDHINIWWFFGFWGFSGITNTWSLSLVSNFYSDPTDEFLGNGGAYGGTNCTWYNCTLKLSLIRPVPLDDNERILPFLEYKITFPWWITVPSQYMTLKADAYAYGFFRSRTIRVPQITTNTALDFAILQ
jgi:hypothetical protein